MDRTILLVEDNDDNAAIYTAVLEHFGHRVVRAADGAEGVRLARELRPTLVLLDLSLPVLSGWEVAAAVRADAGTARIPIVICTAHDSPGDRARAISLGCQGFLVKPCSPRRLMVEIERFLRPTDVMEPVAIASEPVMERCTVTVGRVVALGVMTAVVAGSFRVLARRRPRRVGSRLLALSRTVVRR